MFAIYKSSFRVFITALLLTVVGQSAVAQSSSVSFTTLEFRANTANQRLVNLAWVAPQASSNEYFEVERSFDQVNFTTAGLVLDGLEQGGTAANYLFRDSNAGLSQHGTVYYRVKRVSASGNSQISHVVAVSLPSTNTQTWLATAR